jgi:hypothetical protein
MLTRVIILVGRPDLQSAMVDERAVRQMLLGVSTRKYRRSREPLGPEPRARDEQERFVFENRGRSGVEPDKWIPPRLSCRLPRACFSSAPAKQQSNFFPRSGNRIEYVF